MPKTWSDWVALVGAIIGSVTGVLGLTIAYATLQRDRPVVGVTLKPQISEKASLENFYPGIRFGPHHEDAYPQMWYILSAVNTGLRPVHIDKVMLLFGDPKERGSRFYYQHIDEILNEEHRRTSIAFSPQFLGQEKLWSAAFVDDTGREYTVLAPAIEPLFSQKMWFRNEVKSSEGVVSSTMGPIDRSRPITYQ